MATLHQCKVAPKPWPEARLNFKFAHLCVPAHPPPSPIYQASALGFFRTYTYQGPPFTPLRPRDNISYFSSGWTNPPTVDLVALYKTAKGPDDKNLVSRQAWPWGVKSSSALSSWLSQSTVSIVFTHTGWIVSSPNDQDRNSFIWPGYTGKIGSELPQMDWNLKACNRNVLQCTAPMQIIGLSCVKVQMMHVCQCQHEPGFYFVLI